MPRSDTSEKGLENLIVNSLVNEAGYEQGRNEDYDREHAVDVARLITFIETTQLKVIEKLGLKESEIKLKKFLHRLQGEIAKHSVINVLRRGIKDGPAHIDLFYGTPTPGNKKAEELFNSNIFSVTRQLQYSRDKTQLSLDIVIFINGLPIATFELKNRLTKQTVYDAVQQYKRDRDPKELLFHFGRCIVHFAVDDKEVMMCTHLRGKVSCFLPFNKGYNDGAGNPPNPEGLATDYLWKKILSKHSLSDIIENYTQVTEKKEKRKRKRKKSRLQIFPRYHQLDVVRKLLKDVKENGVGKRYLIQHSAGSGKSNSIAWLAHQLIDLRRDNKSLFDSIIIVTDRILLDGQIRDTVKQFEQVAAIVGHAKHSGDLRKFISSGKKIIITTVQKFPFIYEEIGSSHRNNNFAIIIDEAHSSQGGRTAAKMNIALSDKEQIQEEETLEDKINRIIESKKMLNNASYFAFTATPKNKTLEIFGQPYQEGDVIKHRPFHPYTMKQATQERFILDVLEKYTPVKSYYRLIRTIDEDPLFDIKKAQKKLRRYVETHQHAIRQKAEIMIDHFHEQVLAKGLIGGKARAMIITSGIKQAIQYYSEIKDYLRQRKSPYEAIVAFSGEHEFREEQVTEAKLNQFSSNLIREKFREDPYRFLVVADKFQTGYDEPLLHTMYVDKPLSGIKAVQALSRLNRSHPQKHDTFILDFFNESDTIQYAFSDYYRTTILSEETDPNKLHDLKTDLDNYQVYSINDINELVGKYLNGADRDQLDPTLDFCVALYNTELNEDEQVDFKSKSKAFIRTYSFLSTILTYSNIEWEKLSIFLNFLVPKLPAPREDDFSKGVLETIDMDSYRVEKKATINITLEDEDAEIEPVPMSGGGYKAEPELDKLSNIIKSFNQQFGNIEWRDVDKIQKVISEEIPAKVAQNQAYQNAIKNSDKQNARIEHDKALKKVILELFADHTELFKQYQDNQSFSKWLSDTIFQVTYKNPEAA